MHKEIHRESDRHTLSCQYSHMWLWDVAHSMWNWGNKIQNCYLLSLYFSRIPIKIRTSFFSASSNWHKSQGSLFPCYKLCEDARFLNVRSETPFKGSKTVSEKQTNIHGNILCQNLWENCLGIWIMKAVKVTKSNEIAMTPYIISALVLDHRLCIMNLCNRYK